jgi:hypothetical protein
VKAWEGFGDGNQAQMTSIISALGVFFFMSRANIGKLMFACDFSYLLM